MAEAALAHAILTIDLDAIVANWRTLRDRVAPAECASVIKADAYGLGAEYVAPTLFRAGCRQFFVATVEEGGKVRESLIRAAGPNEAPAAAISVLGGIPGDAIDWALRQDLEPVLNSLGDIEVWSAAAKRREQAFSVAVHLDTGMSRLGLPPADVATLAANPDRLEGLLVSRWLSHLACADEPEHPLNTLQHQEFTDAVVRLPRAPTSFANSAGIFLGHKWHGDLVRPGIALYGGNPAPAQPNPMRPVVALEARILQVREIDRHRTVGYGATHRADRRTRLATVGVGYADGWLRSSSNRGMGMLAGRPVPIVGRVSMDLMTFDVSSVPEADLRAARTIALIGDPAPSLDAVAAAAGTIGYEILTALGDRYHRVYVGADA